MCTCKDVDGLPIGTIIIVMDEKDNVYSHAGEIVERMYDEHTKEWLYKYKTICR